MSIDPVLFKQRPLELLTHKKTPDHKVYQYDEDNFIVIGTCPGTKKEWEVIVSEAGYRAWASGLLIQRALPKLSVEQREMLITGYTQEGWDLIFPPESED